jgi:hypothetical protein
MEKQERLLPVITLVVYWSPDEWDGPRSIHEMLATQDEEILARVPDYKINLVSPWQMEDADFGKFRTSLAETFQYIKYSKADEESKNKSIEQMLLKGRTPEAIADFCGYDIEEVRKVAEKMSSPACI